MGVNVKQAVRQFVGIFLLFAAALFLPAGTLNWPAGWLYLTLFFSFFAAVNLWLYRHNPGLLQERMRFSTSDQQGWDKIMFPLLMLSPALWLIFIALDAVRFHWSTAPLWLQGVGLVILLASFDLFFLTFRENSYLSTVVRVQTDRGHSVISTGPYHYVRHPMYTGMLLFMIGTPLLLGSIYGVVFGLLMIVVLARRAVLEEQTLRANLRGYGDYMAQVRYRFVPHVW